MVLAGPANIATSARAADQLPRVKSITIRGARAASSGELRSLMRTRGRSFWHPFRKSPFRRDILNHDLERLEAHYHNLGYLEARAALVGLEQDEKSGGVAIEIAITEGEPTRVERLAIHGNRTQRRSTILAAIATRPADPYSPAQLELDRQAIVELYAAAGRPFTTVRDSVEVAAHQARVALTIREAPPTRVGDIRIEGTRATKHFVIRRELTFGIGDLLRRHEVEKSRERLLQTGFFRDVRFELVQPDSTIEPRLLDLAIRVRERKMGWVEAGVGYNSSKQLQLAGEVGHRNVLGNAHRLVGDTRERIDLEGVLRGKRPALVESRVGVSFREPRLFSTRTVGTIALFDELTRQPERVSEGIQEEDIRGVSLAADWGLNTPLHVRTTFLYRWITQQVRPAAGGTGGDGADQLEENRFTTRSLSLFVQRDRRDNPFDPLVGGLQTLAAELAGGALEGTSFMKLSLESSWYHQLPTRLVVAARVRGGWIHPYGALPPGMSPLTAVPREDRFKAGGATSVRGYPEDSLGPQSITPGQKTPATERGLVTIVTNLELRFPFLGPLGGALFLDGGNVWEEARRLSIGDFWPDDGEASLEDVRYSVGGGVRFGTPVGPMRVDYGYGLVRGEPEREIQATSGGEWHFSLGQAF